MKITGSYYLERWRDWSVPVISVPEKLNPFKEDEVDLSVVLMNHLPYENVKSLTVLGLLMGAKDSGRLHGVHTLVEATSGNTGVVLAAMAKSFGISRVKLVVANDLPEGKRFPLIMAGAELIPAEEGLSGIGTARKLGRKDGWLNLDQYANLDGTALHFIFNAPKILDGISYPPTVFVAGIGTGGTLVGIARYLHRQLSNITIVGALLVQGDEIPGVRDLGRMREITLPWKESSDEIVEIETRPSYLAALWFNWVMGITPGPSSGFAYLGALKFLSRHKKDGTLDSFRDEQGRVNVVILFPDSNRPYGDRFTAYLPTDFFKPDKAPLPWKFSGHGLW